MSPLSQWLIRHQRAQFCRYAVSDVGCYPGSPSNAVGDCNFQPGSGESHRVRPNSHFSAPVGRSDKLSCNASGSGSRREENSRRIQFPRSITLQQWSGVEATWCHDFLSISGGLFDHSLFVGEIYPLSFIPFSAAGESECVWCRGHVTPAMMCRKSR